MAVIEGSAGIGKTRLLTEARTIAGGMGLRVLAARGGELEREFAFGLVRQLFEPLLATVPAEERAELFSGAAGLAAPLFGESGLDEAPAGDVSFAILHGLYWLAANAALSQPTLLLVDDVHWADAPSLRWLSYVARRLEGLPLMIAVGTRPIPRRSFSGQARSGPARSRSWRARSSRPSPMRSSAPPAVALLVAIRSTCGRC